MSHPSSSHISKSISRIGFKKKFAKKKTRRKTLNIGKVKFCNSKVYGLDTFDYKAISLS